MHHPSQEDPGSRKDRTKVKRLSRILSSERNESSLALNRLQREKENLAKMVDALQADLEDKRDEILRLHK